MSDDHDDPDFTDLLDSFAEIAKDVAAGDSLVLTLENGAATLEVFIEGYSVFKQRREIVTTLDLTESTDRN
jgi:hypothetical protein